MAAQVPIRQPAAAVQAALEVPVQPVGIKQKYEYVF
jgi:hypothetical protein